MTTEADVKLALDQLRAMVKEQALDEFLSGALHLGDAQDCPVHGVIYVMNDPMTMGKKVAVKYRLRGLERTVTANIEEHLGAVHPHEATMKVVDAVARDIAMVILAPALGGLLAGKSL